MIEIPRRTTDRPTRFAIRASERARGERQARQARRILQSKSAISPNEQSSAIGIPMSVGYVEVPHQYSFVIIRYENNNASLSHSFMPKLSIPEALFYHECS